MRPNTLSENSTKFSSTNIERPFPAPKREKNLVIGIAKYKYITICGMKNVNVKIITDVK